MLNWFYQFVLSAITRILSWFGLSFGKVLEDTVEAVQVIQSAHAAPSDEPHEKEHAVEAYSSESAMAPLNADQ